MEGMSEGGKKEGRVRQCSQEEKRREEENKILMMAVIGNARFAKLRLRSD